VQRTEDGRTDQVLGGLVIERSSGVVCGLYHACGYVEREFLGWALKPRSTGCEWFGLKTTQTVFSGLASKPVVTVSPDCDRTPSEMRGPSSRIQIG
jgi:hypothetical protein